MKIKIVFKVIATIGASFTGVFAVWEVIDYISNKTFFSIKNFIPLYIFISVVVSLFSVFILLRKNINIKRKDKIDTAKRIIREHLGYNPAYQLKYDESNGKIFNKTSVDGSTNGERQALLRVETFNNVLDSIYEFSQNNKSFFLPNVDTNDFCNKLIHDSGYKCGLNFAEREILHFHQNVDEKTPIDGFKEVLNRWCSFDSKAGLGMFSVGDLVENEENDVETIEFNITLIDDFVAEGLPGKSHGKRCYFMQGYCEGVCDILAEKFYPGYSFKISNCKVKGCRYKHNPSKVCVYNIRGYSKQP